ncbi:MAG: M48 family metallopeptidase [Rubrivivax sp.]|nr:M48 family metallopeptidase [Rubrivivax sp.]
MAETLQLGELAIELVRKDIRQVHLSVHPPAGRVRIAAPERMRLETVRVFAIAQLGWIRTQQRRMRAQPREPRRELVERESHWLWGRRLLLELSEAEGPMRMQATAGRLRMQMRPGSGRDAREVLLERWYRDQVREVAAPLMAHWCGRMGVEVAHLFVQRMKTRWGSCSPAMHSVRLNTELAKKPVECLEFVLVHELAHLIEPGHGERFTDLMNALLPPWRHRRDKLNRLPLPHAAWKL